MIHRRGQAARASVIWVAANLSAFITVPQRQRSADLAVNCGSRHRLDEHRHHAAHQSGSMAGSARSFYSFAQVGIHASGWLDPLLTHRVRDSRVYLDGGRE